MEEKMEIKNKKEFVKQTHNYLKEKGNYFAIEVVISKDEKEPVFTNIEIENVTNTEIAKMIDILGKLKEDLEFKYPLASIMSKMYNVEADEI